MRDQPDNRIQLSQFSDDGHRGGETEIQAKPGSLTVVEPSFQKTGNTLSVRSSISEV